MESLTQSEMAVIEKISEQIHLSVNIEHFENGNIIYISDSISDEQFNDLRKLLLQSVDIINPTSLPDNYGEWYDSIFKDTYYFDTTGKKYLDLIIKILKFFVGEDPAGLDLIKRIFQRVVQEAPTMENLL
jgi:hypothetical protein